jgi:uncharacterized membrane protein YjfL (UPF0719 family)
MTQSSTLDLSAVAAGLAAYAVAILLSTLLVFLVYRLNTWVTTRVEEERLLLSGHRSVAIALGAVLLSQAWLLRHAVFPIMVMVRDLMLQPASLGRTLFVIGQSLLILVTLGVLSFASVAVAAWLFARLTGKLREHEEIMKDNVAVAIFFAFALFAITAILNEGVEDLSRSLIPYGRSGILHIQ